MASLAGPLGRMGMHPNRRLKPPKPPWRTGTARRQIRCAAGVEPSSSCLIRADDPHPEAGGPWVTPTSAEEAHIAGIVRAPVSCGTPCAAGGSDPRIQRQFTILRCGRDHHKTAASCRRIRFRFANAVQPFFSSLDVRNPRSVACPACDRHGRWLIDGG